MRCSRLRCTKHLNELRIPIPTSRYRVWLDQLLRPWSESRMERGRRRHGRRLSKWYHRTVRYHGTIVSQVRARSSWRLAPICPPDHPACRRWRAPHSALLIAHISETDGTPASATRNNAEVAFADPALPPLAEPTRPRPPRHPARSRRGPASPRHCATITVTGGSFDPPCYTFDGGAPPTLEVGKACAFETSGVSASTFAVPLLGAAAPTTAKGWCGRLVHGSGGHYLPTSTCA